MVTNLIGVSGNVYQGDSITVNTATISGFIATNVSAVTARATRGTFGNIYYGSATILSGTLSILVNLSGKITNVDGSPSAVLVTVNTSGFNGTPYQAVGYDSGSFTVITTANTSSDVAVSYAALYNP